MARPTADESIQQMKDLVQPHVPEPVVAVGVLHPAGAWGNMAVTKFSPGLGMLRRRNNNQKAGGLAKTGLFGYKTAFFAVTADRVYALGATPKSRTWVVADPTDSWDRTDLRITTKPGSLATRVVLDVTSTGDHYELEATTAGDNGFTAAFLAELTATPNAS
jgi:hypothetical protein